MPWVALGLLAGAFGTIEAATVVHLRRFLDPDGSRFPLVAFPAELLHVERLREAATLVLLAVGAELAASSRQARLAAFLLLFGAWDIAYYGALRAFLGWPRSVGDWDLLFLLPVPWLGPVYAPLSIAAVMVLVGIVTLRHERQRRFRVLPLHLAAAALGGLLCTGSFAHPAALHEPHLPVRYRVELLVAGLGLGIAAYADAWRRNARRPA